MPLPRAVARINKRFTNRFIEPIVRRSSGFAVVRHTGRRSGVRYRTPVNVFDRDEALLVALTYGPSADWVRNVMASGGSIRRGDTDMDICATSIVGRDVAWPCLPRFVRAALRMLRVEDFLLIEI